MRALLIGLAIPVAALFATPAAAVDPNQLEFTGSGSSSHGVVVFGGSNGDFRRDHRRHRDSDGDIFIGEWPQQGDTAWRSDSFNDWWHDRPDRAYPRWMLNNQNCEKRWYQGDVLKC